MNVAEQYRIRGASASEIAASVERGVRDCALGPSDRLPTVRTLARELTVSPATVAAAYRLLRLRGLVTGDGRRGTRVSGRPPLPTRAQLPVPAGVRDLAQGNPDPRLLPALPPVAPSRRLYGEPAKLPALAAAAASGFAADGIDAAALAIVGGALDGIERVLAAQLRPGDRVAVEDPCFTRVLDLLAALALVPVPVELDDAGPRPAALARALAAGVEAVIVTPRAQNPTGAALDAARARELAHVLAAAPELLVVEDDHAAAVAGAPARTLVAGRRRWAVVRSMSKALGPDLRVAFLAGDAETVARVEGRQLLGTGWVSHVLQELVVRLLADPAARRLLRRAETTYAARRSGLLRALAAHGLEGHGRSGMNVWIPVSEEEAAVAALLQAGYAVRAGEPFRLSSPPAVRVTVSELRGRDAERIAGALAAAFRPGARTPAA